jgi:dolichol kinase
MSSDTPPKVKNLSDTNIEISPKECQPLNTVPSNFETLHDKYHRTSAMLFVTVIICALIVLIITTTLHKGIDPNTLNRFWLNQGVKYVSIGLIQFVCGLLVHKFNVNVAYTRKIVHIFYFVFPQLLDTILLSFDKNIFTELWNIVIIFLLLSLILEPIRERSVLFQIMFKAIDRPKDRPYTVFWFITQLVVSIPIIAGFSILFSYWGRDPFIFIPLIILVFGDGLAEPIGTRFGYHKYSVKGFYVSDVYTRSFEGSACVYFFSVVAVAANYNNFTKESMTFALLTLPVIMPLVEAKSPHTWDNPIILLVGYVLLACAYAIETRD